MKIVFVCTGNACRSVSAEARLKKIIADNKIHGVEVFSCGTNVHGYIERDEIMCHIADEKGYTMGGIAVQATEELLNSADRIIVMTKLHHEEVTRLLNYDHWDRIVLFNEFCFGDASDLHDPHFQTEYVYGNCFDSIERGCQAIIKKLN